MSDLVSNSLFIHLFIHYKIYKIQSASAIKNTPVYFSVDFYFVLADIHRPIFVLFPTFWSWKKGKQALT